MQPRGIYGGIILRVGVSMLTDVQLRRLTPAEKPYKRADTGGLFILVQPNGSRLWRMKYRFGGREKLLSFGAYPEVSLAAARDARDAARSELRADRDLDSNDRPRARPILVVSGHGQERVYSLKRDCLRRDHRLSPYLYRCLFRQT